MDVLLKQVGVSEDVRRALLGEPGPYTSFVLLASAYTKADWDRVIELAWDPKLTGVLPRLYTQAGRWARAVLDRD